MLYAKIVNDEVVEWPLYEKDLKERHNNVSFPETPSIEDFEALGYTAIDVTENNLKPDKNNVVVLSDLKKDSDGNWVRSYQLSPVKNETTKIQRLDRQWGLIKHQRDLLFAETDWRILRSLREAALGLDASEDIYVVEQYRQDLANITDQDDPFNIEWPEKV